VGAIAGIMSAIGPWVLGFVAVRGAFRLAEKVMLAGYQLEFQFSLSPFRVKFHLRIR
jgi:hypothetical protein